MMVKSYTIMMSIYNQLCFISVRECGFQYGYYWYLANLDVNLYNTMTALYERAGDFFRFTLCLLVENIVFLTTRYLLKSTKFQEKSTFPKNPRFFLLNPRFLQTPLPPRGGGYGEKWGILGFNFFYGFLPYGFNTRNWTDTESSDQQQ